MKILILAEHNGQTLNPATLHAIGAARTLNAEIHLLVAGHNCRHIAEEAATIENVSKVLYADAPHYADSLAEDMAALLVAVAESYRYLAAAADAFGKNIMPRTAALLDCPQISDITEIEDKNTFVRPIYAGNAFTAVSAANENQLVLTFRSSAFEAAAVGGGQAEIISTDTVPPQNLSRLISREYISSDRPELTQARVVVSGGRALGSAEQFNALLTPLADALGAAIGASRAAVDAEYAPNDYQVGQTGKIVAPELYIALGISGAIQHIAGMQDSKVIVAINKDPDAPIFNVADFGIVGDLFEIVPQLTQALQTR